MQAELMVSEGMPAVSPNESDISRGDFQTLALGGHVWIVDLCNRLGAEYAAHVSKISGRTTLVGADESKGFNGRRLAFADLLAAPQSAEDSLPDGSELPEAPARIVLFLPAVSTMEIQRVVDRCATIAGQPPHAEVCVVGTVNIRDGADRLTPFEESVVARFREIGAKTTLVRTGFVVDPAWQWPVPLAALCRLFPLVPMGAAGAFLERGELFAALDRVVSSARNVRFGRVALLGASRPWREMLRDYVHPCPITTVVTSLAWLLSWLQIGRLCYWSYLLIARANPRWRRWLFATLDPQSVAELLSLCHPVNRRHIALAGYNTGVVHFGWKYPGCTVVRTIGSGRQIRVGRGTIIADAGILLKRAIRELRDKSQEFFVVPNYSYVSLGTAFMVPVHGSGSEVSTLGETIEQVSAYDPSQDKIVRLRRGDDQFGRCLYNPASGLIVLRLRMRVRKQSRYFVKKSELAAPSAADAWQAFADPAAANIELRKSRAKDPAVSVSKYYTTSAGDPQTLEIPRDSIGKLWDRLEENAMTAWAFHTLVRKFGFHVELFLDEREFAIFWESHTTLPLSKLQLRLMRRDALPESPFGDCDRISIDIFMKRKDSAAFISFMKEHLPHARFNPGKHSM
jgi:hypothetical protein